MNALIEILTEELPASYIPIALSYLKKSFEDILKENNIKFEDIILNATPRRICIFFKNIKEDLKEKEKIIVGPPKEVGEKNPKALEGFLKKFKAKKENLKVLTNPPGKKGTYFAIVLREKPLSFQDIIKSNFEKIILNIPFPKKMRWSKENIAFARPIRSLLALIDDKVLDLKLGNLKSTNITFGHKIMSKEKIKVKKADYEKYEKKLKENFVILKESERKNLILNALKKLEEKGYKAISPENLIDEIVYLVEYVHPIIGNFDEKYLILPKELIYLVLKVHQRMFAFEKNGKIQNIFLGISNTKPLKDNVVKEGYEKVVKARLEDAYFYYKEDQKIPLSKRKNLLKNIVFHEKLGTYYDFINYLHNFEKEISDYLASQIENYFSFKEKLKILFDIYKNDLTTHLVDEFDELQGVIGKYYALNEGFEQDIAKAIEDVYKDVPESQLGAYLSLLDKLLALVGFFVVGERVKGSYDPYGLKRLATNILNILLKFKLDLDLKYLIEKALKVYEKFGFKIEENLQDKILNFIKERFKNRLLEEGHRYDLVNVILKDNIIYRAYLKLLALEKLSKQEEFKDLLITFRRIFNILKDNKKYFKALKAEPTTVYEKELLKAFENIEKDLNLAEKNKDYYKVYSLLSTLKPKIDALFDNVMIMEKDPSLREKRLKTLGYLANKLLYFGDFSKVGMKKEA